MHPQPITDFQALASHEVLVDNCVIGSMASNICDFEKNSQSSTIMLVNQFDNAEATPNYSQHQSLLELSSQSPTNLSYEKDTVSFSSNHSNEEIYTDSDSSHSIENVSIEVHHQIS